MKSVKIETKKPRIKKPTKRKLYQSQKGSETFVDVDQIVGITHSGISGLVHNAIFNGGGVVQLSKKLVDEHFELIKDE